MRTKGEAMEGTIAHVSTPPLVAGAAPGEKFELVIPSNLPQYPSEVVKYAAAGYGFLVPLGQRVSLQDLAALIEASYSLENPQNREVVRVLRA